MVNLVRWVLATFVVLVAIAPPYAYFRHLYNHTKRFREVTPGRFYRSGQMTADGLRQISARHKIKTVINLQHEAPDPLLPDYYMGEGKIRESELCRELGIKYILLTPDVIPPGLPIDCVPPVAEEFLALLDDESNYPILLHCKAGLHRTGRLTAIYRMEYMDWSQGEALRELRANGYGFRMASEADQYIIQFLKNYVPRKDRVASVPVAPAPRPAPARAPRPAPARATTTPEGGGL